jgi:hypothetical protein
MHTRRSLPKGWLLATQKNSVLSSRNESAKECPILQERDSVLEHQPKLLQNPSAALASPKLCKLSFTLARGKEKPIKNCMIQVPRPVSINGGNPAPEWCKNLPVSELKKAKKNHMAPQEFKGEIKPRKIPIHFAGQNKVMF